MVKTPYQNVKSFRSKIRKRRPPTSRPTERSSPGWSSAHRIFRGDEHDFTPRFLATIEPLVAAGKLGPVLFQLPPNLKMDATLLQGFLAILPRSLPAAFEFRHASWFADSIWELLRSHQRAVCIAETETMTTPDVVTASFAYYRFLKPTYTGDERRSMVTRIAEHIAAGRDVFAYFKHEETPEGALYAVDLLREATGAERAPA